MAAGTQLLAVEDTGRWVSCEMQHENQQTLGAPGGDDVQVQTLVGVNQCFRWPELGVDGQPLDTDKTQGDSESLVARLPPFSTQQQQQQQEQPVLVSFERNHRVLRYHFDAAGQPVIDEAPKKLELSQVLQVRLPCMPCFSPLRRRWH